MGHTQIVSADLDYPCRELFVCGLLFVVALSICWQTNFLCVYFGRAIERTYERFVWRHGWHLG